MKRTHEPPHNKAPTDTSEAQLRWYVIQEQKQALQFKIHLLAKEQAELETFLNIPPTQSCNTQQ